MSIFEDEFAVLWTLQSDSDIITAVKANLPLSFRAFACGFVFIADLAAFGLENSKIGFHKISFLLKGVGFRIWRNRLFEPVSVHDGNDVLNLFLFKSL